MVPGLQFFNFPGSEDGEDIKRQFKSRYAEAETHLTESEKEDIVSEAQHIFSFMLELISDLDLIIQTKEEDLDIEPLLDKSRALVESRDSIAVTHERLLKARASAAAEKDNSNFFEVLVNQPLARLTQLAGATTDWHVVTKPLGPRVSKDGPSLQVSFSPSVKPGETVQWFVTDHCVTTLITITSTLVAFLAWYYMS